MKENKEEIILYDLGNYRKPNTLSDDQVYANVLEAAKIPQKKLEKNEAIIFEQLEMAREQNKDEDIIEKLDFWGVIYRVAQFHKDKKMDKDEIILLVDIGADLTRKN